ncbi:MAG: hypothetical protein C0171_05290 [Caldisphaera sp.]|nr:MAG: hypothetical protein C0171_05290 [Caldisphaera sp.]
MLKVSTLVLICKDIGFDEFFQEFLFNKVEICDELKNKIIESRKIYEREAKKGNVYGYSTSLGALINKQNVHNREREKIILREHDTSIGKNVPSLLIKATMLVRLIQLSKGNSPVRIEVIERLRDAINNNIIPIVPILGSVGASGDLAPLSRIFRCLIYGEGFAYYNNEKVSCNDALHNSGLEIFELEPGEALALINSNAFSTAMSLINTYVIEKIFNLSLDVAKESLYLSGCNNQHYSEAIYETKKQPGVKTVIEKLNNPCLDTPRLQDPYSIRCIPQIYGALFDTIGFSKEVLKNEMNSSSDNPIIYSGNVYHACQFHAIYSGIISDFLKTAAIPVMNSVERRISQLLDGKINRKSDFLLKEKSVVGAMIMQYTAASISAYSRGSSISMSSHSIPTSGMQEDVVSMAPNSSLELMKINGLFLRLVSIEKAINMFNEEKDLPDPKDLLEKSYEYLINKGDLNKYSELLNYFF